MIDVIAPKISPLVLFCFRFCKSISSPARHIIKYIPTLPNSSNEASLASTFSPCSPISTPAKIMPMRCGMCSLLKIIGANSITHRTRKNIHVGSVMGRWRYEVIASKVIGLVVYFIRFRSMKPYFCAKIHLFLDIYNE